MCAALRDECRRKDRVITRVMASRHSLAQADKKGARAINEKDAALRRKTEEHAEMERLVERLVDEVRSLKDQLAESQSNYGTLQRERRVTQLEVQRLEAERIALEASHEERITAIKAAGMGRSAQEELEEMRLRLDEAVRAQGMLEDMLQKAEDANRALEQKLADLRRSGGGEKPGGDTPRSPGTGLRKK